MTATFALALLLNSVHISLDQDGRLSAGQLRMAVEQIQQIWSEADIAVTAARYGEPSAQGEAVVSLRILRVAAPPTRRGAPILAWTVVGPSGLSQPTLIVSVPSIVALVSDSEFAGTAFTRLTNDVRDELIARAIGRVAAHELGHYLLQKAGHRTGGLMRPSYSARDLVGAWLHPFQVAPGDWPLLRAEVAALARSQTGF